MCGPPAVMSPRMHAIFNTLSDMILSPVVVVHVCVEWSGPTAGATITCQRKSELGKVYYVVVVVES